MTSLISIILDEGSGVPFYRQLVDAVSGMIASGQLQAGDQLPSLRELSAQLSVSSITVRRAYDELEHAGLIQRLRGSGTFVSEGVERMSKRRARKSAETLLRNAIDKTRELGLDDAEIRSFVEHLLDRPSNQPWRM